MDATPAEPEWIGKLNPQQQEAVRATDGPLLVLSGAGTGKTRVLTSKIAYILHAKMARAWEILAMTFTNKAANEMKTRVKALAGEEAEGLWIGTFHSIGLRILRSHPELAGMSKNFMILDEDDQTRLIRRIIEDDLRLDSKMLPPAAICEIISRQKDKGFLVDASADMLGKASPLEAAAHTMTGTELDIYRRYQARLKELNAVDFGDLLLLPLMIFTKHKEILESYQRKFRYILVDEYQDTNAVQYKLLKLLSGHWRNIACVGDDDQSIYSWRGAEIDNILQFEKDFAGARVVRLETNYRSVPPILAAASGVIAHNLGRLGKTLRPCERLERETRAKVKIYGMQSGLEEASVIVGHIANYHSLGTPYSEMAVLVRSGYQTRLFEDRLLHRGIPYRIIGGTRFYERQEIKDVIAYLRLIAYPHDDLSFERAIGAPKRGLGEKVIEKISEEARLKGIHMMEAAAGVAPALAPKQRRALGAFCSQFARWRETYSAGSMRHYEFARMVLDESGYMEMWKNSKKEEGEARLQNIEEFLGMLKSDYESIAEFLEYVALFAAAHENFTEADAVSLMTMHAAKGLEFEIVFLPSWEMGIFPNDKALKDGGLEEERRLAYVSMTRAKTALEIYYAYSRQTFGSWTRNMPSMFLGEIPEGCFEHLAAE